MSVISRCWAQDAPGRLTLQELAAELSRLLNSAVETARRGNGGDAVASSTSVESAITTLDSWLSTICGLQQQDSYPLAHALVTTKSITSVKSLGEVLAVQPNLLTHDLKVALAHSVHITQQLREPVQLKDLKVEQVCALLQFCDFGDLAPLFAKERING